MRKSATFHSPPRRFLTSGLPITTVTQPTAGATITSDTPFDRSSATPPSFTVDPGPQQVVPIQTPAVEFVGDPDDISAVLSLAFSVPSSGVVADGSRLELISMYGAAREHAARSGAP